MPKVSVVIPVFNGERFIGCAIQSVLDQTFREFEIIVVDDGSTDRTEKIVRQFSAAISYHHQQNRGAGVARNLGVSRAQGDWVAFLDADDIWRPDKLAVQIEQIETYPEVAFFYSDIDLIDEEGNLTEAGFLSAKLERRKEKGRTNLVSLVFDNRPFPYPSTVLTRKDVFLKAGGFNPEFRGNYHEDFDAFARVARTSLIHFIPQSLVMYRVTSPQDKNVVSIRDENGLILLKCLREMWRDEPAKQIILLHYYAKYFSDRGRDYLSSSDYDKARRYFRLAFSHRPLYWKNLRRWALTYLPGFREFYVFRKTRTHRDPHL